MRDNLSNIDLRVFLLICIVFLCSLSQVKAETVKVRAATHDGYGRIVFNWPTLVPYEIETVGDQLVVSFSNYTNTGK